MSHCSLLKAVHTKQLNGTQQNMSQYSADTTQAKCCTYALTYMKSYISQEVTEIVYFAYSHCIMSYGIIFWGNSIDY
jgi:hypothetical protein